MLDLAARQADDIAALERLLAEQGPIVTGSTGQPRLSPVFTELRQSRLALGKLLAELRLPDEGLGSTRNVKNRRSARARWDAHNAARDGGRVVARGERARGEEIPPSLWPDDVLTRPPGGYFPDDPDATWLRGEVWRAWRRRRNAFRARTGLDARTFDQLAAVERDRRARQQRTD